MPTQTAAQERHAFENDQSRPFASACLRESRPFAKPCRPERRAIFVGNGDSSCAARVGMAPAPVGWARPTICARLVPALLIATWWAAPTLHAAQSTSPAAMSQPADAAFAVVRADEQKRIETFAKAAQAVVCIFESPDRGGGGSGVLIHPDGYGLSNFHVVQGFIESRRGYGGLSDGKLYPLTVLGIDPGGDIVLFKLGGRDTLVGGSQFPFAPLGDSDSVRLGDFAAAMGNPFLVAEDFTSTITFGNVSGLHRYQEGQGNFLEYADCIQVSTSINPGNSGGPLFDMHGRVIGINGRGSFEERGRVNVGLGYAVSINQIKRFLPGLYAGRMMHHGTLGVTVQQLGGDIVVNAMQALSPAEKAGLRLGDKLLSINGRPIRTPNDFNNAVTILPADWPTRISYSRDGKVIETTARLERVTLKAPMPYVPDLDRNHAQIERLFAAAMPIMKLPAESGAVDFEISVGPPGENGDSKISRISVRLTKDGESQSPETMWSEGPKLDAALLTEFRTLVRPLLRAKTLDISWELLGGDEVDGRIVYVVQREFDERRVRWMFDLEKAVLFRIEFAEKGGKVQSAWTASGWEKLAEPDLAIDWMREANGVKTPLSIAPVSSR